jgi:hypothetical protein
MHSLVDEISIVGIFGRLAIFLVVTVAIYQWCCGPNSLDPIPGPKTTPVLGNLTLVKRYPNFMQFMMAMGEQYGPLCQIHLGFKRVLLINSTSVYKDLIVDRGVTYSSRDTGNFLTYDILTRQGKPITYGHYLHH